MTNPPPSAPLIAPFLRVVADGVEKDGRTLRATILVTPHTATGADSGFALHEWPGRAAQVVSDVLDHSAPRELTLRWRFAGESTLDWKRACSTHRLSLVRNWGAINKLWAQCFRVVDGWEACLASELDRSMASKAKPGIEPKGEFTPDENPPDLDGEGLANTTGGATFDHDGAILADRPNRGDDATLCGIVPVRHADFAIDEERERALRVQRKLLLGSFSCPEGVRMVDGKRPDSPFQTKKEAQLALRKHLYDGYLQSVSHTNCDRGITNGAFVSAQSILKGAPGVKPVPCVRSGDCGVLPAGAQPSRGSHVYGNWLQRRKTLRYTESQDGPHYQAPSVPEGTLEDHLDAADADKVMGLFYSLQGDPILSRLFCLAVDVEFTLPRELATANSAKYVQLAVGSQRAGKPLVITAARYEGTSRVFWPVSIFEAGLSTPSGAPGYVEQRDGIWNLGCMDAADVEPPRWDLTSLDIRRAVDAKPNASDRGERHITGGFSLLDRGRGNQIARELAITSLHTTDGVQEMVLYAESLTVGRRVDVAAVQCGAAATEKAPWRSLFWRRIEFGFPGHQAEAEQALVALLPKLPKAHGGFLEETSFQVVARHLPMLPGQESKGALPHEIVAEEAVFLWDGTPASVLTLEGGRPKEAGMNLPFERRHEPPKASDSSHSLLRPPPLRYGVPYVFSLRSVFAGGGSPSTDDAASYHVRNGGAGMLPPAEAARLRPRRFLRHESIQAPNLLIPVKLALKRYGVMGFEQLDQAIVRTCVPADEEPQEPPSRCLTDKDSQPPRGNHEPPYEKLASRFNPSWTTRVFVAPEATVDQVARHGRLDGSDFERVLEGGLRDVGFVRDTYARAPDDSTPRTSGFPSVITSRLPTLDGDAVYTRTRVSAGSKQPGIPVFEVGEKGHDVPKNAIGWLPDPGAWQFSVRARARGSDRYLRGDLTANLYEPSAGIRYPDALPLAVCIKRGAGLRTSPAFSIQELSQHGVTNAPLGRLGVDGGSAAAGARVRLIVLELREGEDFDLEVACLPRPESFALTFSLPQTIAQQRAHAARDTHARATLEARCGAVDLRACQRAGRQSLAGLASKSVPDANVVSGIARELIEAARASWPIEEIAAVARLRVCHALNRPRGASGKPRWGTVGVARPTPPASDSFYRPPGPDQPGTKTLLLTGELKLDLEQIDAFEIIVEGVAVSGQLMDDPTRSRSLISRRSGRWPMLTLKNGERSFIPPCRVVGFDVDARGRVTLPQEKITLLRVDNLPTAWAIGPLLCPPPPADTAHKAPADTGTTTPDTPASAGTAAPQIAASAGAAPDSPTKGEPTTPETLEDDDAPAPKKDGWVQCAPNNPIFGDTQQRHTTLNLSCLHAAAIAGAKIKMAIAAPEDTRSDSERMRQISATQPKQLLDTRARHLRLQVRGLSRFAEIFETQPVYINKAEPLLHRRQALKREEQSILSETYDVWAPATERPPACAPRRPEPSFLWERWASSGCRGCVVQVVTRRAVTRLYFGRGWFSSGEGERVGLVLWPPDYFDKKAHDFGADTVSADDGRRMSIADFDDSDIGPAGAFITRWGGDPIRGDARPQDVVFIPPSAFADSESFTGEPRCEDSPHKPRTVAQAFMPVRKTTPQKSATDGLTEVPAATDASGNKGAAANEQQIEYRRVSLLTYEPCFDLDREEFYVDVDLRTYRPSEPIVRLGLVRYQEHAICEKVMVSEPVAVSIALLPPRRLEVSAADSAEGGCTVDVMLVGPGSVKIKDLEVEQIFKNSPLRQQIIDDFAAIQRPLIRVVVFHETFDALSRTSVLCDQGKCEEHPKPIDEELVYPDLIEEELVWKRRFLISGAALKPLGRGRLVVYVEEFDRRLPATYDAEPILPENQFNKETQRDSGPRFIARVPFWKLDNVGSDPKTSIRHTGSSGKEPAG